VCADRRAEVELACREILRLVRDEGFRYKEISIVVRDLEPYADLLGARLTDAGVPHYIDRRIQLSGHAAVLLLAHGVRLALEYARLALNVPGSPLAYPEDVYALLKTDLQFPLGTEPARSAADSDRLASGRDVLDRLQAHAKRHNLPVHAWLADEPWGERGAWFGERSALAQTGIPAFHDQRLAAAAPLRELADRMVECGGRLDLPRMLEHAWQCIFTERVQQTLQAWADAANGSPMGGHPAAPRAESVAASHRGVLQAIAGLFDELALVGRDITLAWEADEQSSNVMSFSEFLRWLNFGLSELSLGYPPAVDDCVLLTGVERGRHPPVRATLILGLSEDEWPSMSQQTAFLSDAERAITNGANSPDESSPASGKPVGEPRLLVATGSEARAMREPYLALVAATRPAEYLFITHPLADRDGRELKPSRYFRGLCKALGIEPDPPSDRPATTATLAADPLSAAGPGDLAIAAALSPQSGELAHLAEELSPGSLTAALTWGLAYRQSREQRGAASRWADMLLDSGTWQALLFPDAERGRLTGVPLSPSQLETYAACPFQHFAKYLLRLKAEDDFALGPLKVGELLHRTLQAGVSTLLQAASSSGDAAFWHTLKEDEFVAALEPALAELAERLGALTGRDRVAHVLERARLVMRFFARHLLGVFAADEGRHPRDVELAFGRLAKLPPLPMEVSGRTMLLEGKVDRLDVDSSGLGTVVDYKLGQPRLDWWALKEGLSIQLPLYLLAIQSLAAGGRLGEIEPRIVEVERIEPKGKPKTGDLEFSFRREPKLPRGLAKTMDEADLGKWRDHWLNETKLAARRVAERMLSLRIEPHPLRSPNLGWVACQGCAYRAVCRFDHAAGDRFRQARNVDSRAEAELALRGEDGAC
jgi:ATP-dependent helicase/nuclease subunit B